MEKSKRFADVEVGEELGPVTIEVTPEMIGDYGKLLGDLNSYYTDNTDFGGPVAHPSVASLLASKPFDRSYPQEPGGIHAKQEFEFHNPIRPGVTAKVTGKIVDKFEKRGRKYVLIESRIEDENGVLLVVSRSHSIIPH